MDEPKEFLFAGKTRLDDPNSTLWRVGYLGPVKVWLSKPMPVERAIRLMNRISRCIKRQRDKARLSHLSNEAKQS